MTAIRITRLFYLFVLPNIVFCLVAMVAPADLLVQMLNGAIVALGIGVCIAYFPVIRGVLTDRHRWIDRADILALGIFLGWLAICGRAVWGLVWRYNEKPDDWVDGGVVSYLLYVGVCAAAFHLLAPGAVGHRIPSREWVKVGVICAAGVMSIFVGSWLLNVLPIK